MNPGIQDLEDLVRNHKRLQSLVYGQSMNPRIQELAELIRYHSDLYYNQGKPELSDAEFDTLLDEMKRLDPNNACLSEIGANPTFGKKVKHATLMGSLDKAKTWGEVKKWWEEMNLDKKLVVTPKVDGCFSSDAKVMMANGEERSISSIKEGDCVLSFNEGKGCFEPKAVRHVIVRPKDDQSWVLLTLKNGRQVKCTANHQLLTKNRGWVEAGDLTDDDDLMDVLL